MFELLLGLSIVAVLLGGMVAMNDWLRTRTAYDQTRRTLLCLRSALDAYAQDHGTPPSPPTSLAINALLNDVTSTVVMRHLAVDQHPRHGEVVRDGYGRPLHYLARWDGPTHRGDFISTGPDGTLGDPLSADLDKRLAAADDLSSLDLEIALP